nr:reverse transcriptase domain-containing protein [Tanacetum cinerariifolium]
EAYNHNQNENHFHMNHTSKSRMWGVEGDTYQLSPQLDPRNFFLPKEILPPQKQTHFLSYSSADFAAPPQIFKIGESSHKTPLERHEEHIKTILNHLDELPLERIEKMEDKIRGLGNGRDFYSGNDHRGYPGSPPIRYKESSRCDLITMDLLPLGFLEPLYPGFMNVVHNQDIKHMIPPTSPRDTETPIGSPMPLSPSSSVGSSSQVRSTTPPPDYSFDESIFAELDNSLWIIPQPLGSELIFEEPNELDTFLAMTQAAIRQLVVDSVGTALEAQATNMANADNTNRNTKPREVHVARKCSYKEFMSCQPFNFKGTVETKGQPLSNLLPVSMTCHACRKKGHYRNQYPKANNNAHGRADMLRDKNAHQNPNVVTGTLLLNQQLARVLFDSGADKSFVSISLASMLNIPPITIDTIYDIEMVDGNLTKVLSDQVLHLGELLSYLLKGKMDLLECVSIIES